MELNKDITIIGETNFRNQNRKFGIKTADRSRHVYVVGKTGTGKTTLLENMAIQDIQRGHGLAVVDPHGEFAEKMLDFVPSNRVNDVIYFNPADLDYPIAFNAIEKVVPEYRHLIASGLMGVFKKIWPDVWSARMEYILHNSVLALLEYPGTTLLGINRMLADKDYRKKVVDRLADPAVKSFWVNEFAKYPERFREEAVAPIQNKVGQFISSPLIRNIIGQTKSSLDFQNIMNNQKILIVNLSKGKIGEDASKLLGALCITKLQLAAMARVNIPEAERKDFYLYVDEFQNFVTESFANILSEARKYHLDLILTHQYIDQLVTSESTVVKEAIFGNVGTMITFRVGAADAEFLEKEFEPEFMMNDLINLGFAQVYLKLMIDGMASRPFSANTLPPFPRAEKSHREKIIGVSRERYATKRSNVEQKIAKWSGVMAGEAAYKEKEGGKKAHVEVTQLYEDVCWNCGKKTQVKFIPDGKRPIYCSECLQKIRAASPPTGFVRQGFIGGAPAHRPVCRGFNEGGSLALPSETLREGRGEGWPSAQSVPGGGFVRTAAPETPQGQPFRRPDERQPFRRPDERQFRTEQRPRIERQPSRVPRRPERVNRPPLNTISDGELSIKGETKTISLDEATKNNSIRNVAHTSVPPGVSTGESKKPGVEVNLDELRKTLRGVLFGEGKEEKK
ncbi:MAG: type IV secretion system DNA-binding domain-containing protein [Candidatus Portnoybacteria bacterium]|nr:type IV secretion system DNA-binding domain-containing protein [Candidatus Portnoybacteria bacterium]